MSFRYETSIAENSGPALLVTVRVSDADGSAFNSAVRLSLVNASSNISFSASSLQQTTNFTNADTFSIFILDSVDYELQRFLAFSVLAVDHGGLTSSTQVVVTITDVNDQPPVFSSPIYSRNVSEAATVGQLVTTMLATDADERGTPAATVQYSIVSGNVDNVFALNRTSGELVLRAAIDYETRNAYTLNISAADTAVPHFTAFAQVLVSVLDANDNDPVFNVSNGTISIAEDLPAGQFVAAFGATDADSGLNGQVEFSITSGNPSPALFAINATTGLVTTIASLDYEAQTPAAFNLTITASDLGTPRRAATAWVAVDVIDVNDNAPVFSQLQFSAQVERILTANQVVVNSLTATDADTSGNFGTVSYRFVSGNENNLFSINATTGQIVTRSSFCSVTSSSTLRVEAFDGGIPPQVSANTATIDVSVSNVNHNNPVFPINGYRRVIIETTAQGTLIETVSATDVDCGDQANLVYSIIGGLTNPPLFAINNLTGAVTLLAPVTVDNGGLTTTHSLDATTTPSYFLTIQADDRGAPTSRTGVTVLEIDVVDDNDNSPVFSQTNGYFTYYEQIVFTPQFLILFAARVGTLPTS